MDAGRNCRGQILVLSALMMPVLVFVVALAVDVGFLFDYRRQAQTAADSGAQAAALQLYTTPSATFAALEAAARADTALNGFTHGVDGIDVTLNRPPLHGYYAGNNDYVEVVVTRPTPTFLMKILGPSLITVSASAVGGPGNSRGCIYVLTEEAGKGLWVTGTARINAENCEIYDNSDMLVDSGAEVHAKVMNVSRNRMGSGQYDGRVFANTGMIVADPLDLGVGGPAFPNPATCGGALIIPNGVTVANPGCYESITVENVAQTVTFNPGNYYAKTGGVLLRNATTVVGTDVTFFLENEKFELSGHATLRAPRSTSAFAGAIPGMLIFMRRDLNRDIEFKNDSTSNLEGTIYTRSGKILYSGTTSGTAMYTILVAKEMLYDGTGTLNNDLSALPAGGPIRRPGLAD
jgi:Putative Flp pilus-assembly TadE/G-like